MNDHTGIRRTIRDIVDLCELQMQLLSVDSQEARQKASKALACGVVAVSLLGSALTTALVGGGFLLREWADWSTGASLLAVAAGVFVLVLALLWVALRLTQSASAAMSETKSEFSENLKWLKAVLLSPSTSARNQIRAESFPETASTSTRGPDAAFTETHGNGR